MIKIYTELHEIPEDAQDIKHTGPLIKLQREMELTANIQMVNSIDVADYYMLPYPWGYYIWHGETQTALQKLRYAASIGKQSLVWFLGDLEPYIKADNVILFSYATEFPKPDHYIIPPFIDDPLAKHFNNQHTYRAKQGSPIVGFCGYGATSPLRLSYTIVQNLWKYGLSLTGALSIERPRILPSVLRRNRILGRLAESNLVEDNFIIRDRYRAAIPKTDERNPLVVEFYNNILSSDYTLCVRGFGNWSIRFYETLACGRIPLFVNTKSSLPYDFMLDWKDYVVWVEENELPHIGEKLADFHASITPDEFIDRQKACRQLWEDYLTLPSFFEHFTAHFDHVTVP